MNDLRIRLTLAIWTTLSGELCLNAIFLPKLENIDGVMKVLQLVWDQLPQASVNKATSSFPKRLVLCECWWWTLHTYAEMNYLSDFGIYNNSQCFLTTEITIYCYSVNN